MIQACLDRLIKGNARSAEASLGLRPGQIFKHSHRSLTNIYKALLSWSEVDGHPSAYKSIPQQTLRLDDTYVSRPWGWDDDDGTQKII